MAANRTQHRLGVKPDFLKALRFDVEDLLQCHGLALTQAGRPLVSSVDPHLDVDLEQHEIRATVKTKGEPVQVTFMWDEDPEVSEPMTDIVCSCPTSLGYDLCKHTWAVTSLILQQILQDHSPLTRTMRGGAKNAWKSLLNPLDQFLAQTRVPEQNQPETLETPPAIRRLVYKIEEDRGHLVINVYEQFVLKNGTWGKGKKMVWSRLAAESPAELAPIDREIAALVQKSANSARDYRSYMSYGYFPSNSSPDVWKLLKLLTGHPLVFHAAELSTPLQIVRGDMELVLTPEGQDQWIIRPRIGKRMLSECDTYEADPEHGIIGLCWTQNELIYWEGPEASVRLIDQLERQPIPIPQAAVPEMLGRLTELERSFKVVYPKEIQGRTLVGNSQIHLRLVPRIADGGLAVELWARPVADGPYFEPGVGTATIARYNDDAREAVERDLHAEQTHAEKCQRDLQLDRFYSHRPWRWMIDAGDATLDFLAEVQAKSDAPWKIEWSNSSVPRPEVVGEITPGNLQLEIGNDHDWFGVEGTIDIGGTKVPLIAVLNALRGNSRYVQLKGGKWALIAAEFRDRLAALDDLLHRNQSKMNLDITAAPLLEDLFKDQQITIKAAQEWRNALRKLELARNHHPQVPADLKADLRDYQVDGFQWLSRLAAWGVGGCLADDMGLGKTVQALAVLVERQKVGPTLVVAPVSVGFNWVNETTRFAPTLRPHLYRDTERGEFLESVGPGDLVVASYGLLLRDAEYFTKIRWGTLVLDEAQFIKNSRTKSAQVVRELNAEWRLTLTGTPVENQLGDLWSLFRATSPGLFGSWERFRERFADPIEKQKIPERSQALARTVRPFILRRTKAEVLKELPPRTEMILTAELSKPERKLYEDARLFALTQLAGIDTGKNESRFQVLAMLTRLRQLACHPGLVDEKWKGSSAKLDVLLETVEEIREGQHRALVFSQFTSHLEIIRKALDERNISYLYLDGQTPEKQRRERVEAFQGGKGDLFLISLKAGGTGLNLTGADYVIHMDPWWNPAVEDQATDRAHRIGQNKAVMVYRVVAQETIEEKILALHEKKRNLVAGIMEGSDQAGKLSTDELIDLIKASHAPEMPATPPKARAAKSRANAKTKAKTKA